MKWIPDGYDVISTIDVYIQDIAHHALLKQLEDYRSWLQLSWRPKQVMKGWLLGKAKDGLTTKQPIMRWLNQVSPSVASRLDGDIRGQSC
jgi:membrane carboxypeptidase/penicillin-binding protein